MKKIIILGLFISSLAFSVFAQNAKNEEVINVAKQMLAAQENYDPVALDKIYASDYIEISPKGEVDEREKAIGFYKVENPEKMRTAAPKYILDEFNVRHYGKFAIVIGRLSFGSKTDSSRPPMAAGRVTFGLRKEKGVWKIYSAQFTPFPPPQRPPSK